MSEYKQIKTRIWQDNWFLTLNANEKLLWIFLLTNEYSHISGLFELPKTLISPLVGVKDWEKILLKFAKDKKIEYKNGWVYIKNKTKHQPISENAQDNVNKSIKKYLEENKDILAKLKEKEKPLASPLQATYQTLPEDEDELEDELEDETAETSSAFDFKNKLLLMENSKDKRMNIIYHYWLYKKFDFKNNDQYSAAIKRELRPAKLLMGYELPRIKEVMFWLNGEDWIDWTLETVHKYIDKDLNNIKSKI